MRPFMSFVMKFATDPCYWPFYLNLFQFWPPFKDSSPIIKDFIIESLAWKFNWHMNVGCIHWILDYYCLFIKELCIRDYIQSATNTRYEWLFIRCHSKRKSATVQFDLFNQIVFFLLFWTFYLHKKTEAVTICYSDDSIISRKFHFLLVAKRRNVSIQWKWKSKNKWQIESRSVIL